MAKLLTLKGLSYADDVSTQNASFINIQRPVTADATGGLAFGAGIATIVVNNPGSPHGSFGMRLYDNTNTLVEEVDLKLHKQNNMACILDMNPDPGAAAAHVNNSPSTGLIWQIVDQAKFSTGRLEFEVHGQFLGGDNAVGIKIEAEAEITTPGDRTALDVRYAARGSLNATLAFTVTE
jgi:hypothetical protein